MALIPQSPWGFSTLSPNPRNKTSIVISASLNNDSNSPADEKIDPVKLAFAKAMLYKKKSSSLQSDPSSVSKAAQSTTLSDDGSVSTEKKGEINGGVVGNDDISNNGARLEEAMYDVEMIVGDKSKFERKKLNATELANPSIYKPKISTWGVFPRPSNISRTFGGGRVIRPGEVLESEEDKAVKKERSRQLLAAYRKKTGTTIDPKLKTEGEKALKDGNDLMDMGRLKKALPYYEKVMKEFPFQSELHGLAALQWSICQDSLNRSDEARDIYEKLKSHPNAQVKKKAQQFLFGFEAMEMLKLNNSSSSQNTTGYQNFLEAFVEDKTSYPLGDKVVEEEEKVTLRETLLYIVFLASPILFVLFIAISKGN